MMPAMDSDGNTGVYIMGCTGDIICDLYSYSKDEHGISRRLIPYKNAEANAQLIAAAPTLKDNLIELVDAVDRVGEWDELSRVGEALKSALRTLRGFRTVEDAETPVDNQSDSGQGDTD